MADELVSATPRGLYCQAGDFYIDPWQSVERAVITHAHADHARAGSAAYLCAAPGRELLVGRIGSPERITGLPYGETLAVNGVNLSLHPAGHVLGSAQVRVEFRGEVCVVSGDYKAAPDPTCESFEPVRCNTFITESTFGLPIYRWPEEAEVWPQVARWWRENQAQGRTSVIFAYALGKAQRVLAGLDPSIGPIVVHGAVHRVTETYRAGGVALPPTVYLGDEADGKSAAAAMRGKAMVIAPPATLGTPWLRRFGPASTAMASGWMRVRGRRRHRSLDRGFVISDHADWPALLKAIVDTGATRVGITHGYASQLARYLRERNVDAYTLSTRYEGELGVGEDDSHKGDEAEPRSETPGAGEG